MCGKRGSKGKRDIMLIMDQLKAMDHYQVGLDGGVSWVKETQI